LYQAELYNPLMLISSAVAANVQAQTSKPDISTIVARND
jgi:hypothetical protein